MAEKKYYWLKLKRDFFNQPRIKKLRRIAGGDTYTIIYLKMQLLSLETDGILIFEGIEDDFIEELALTIDEDSDNVRFTVMYLVNQGLMEEVKKDEYALIEAIQSMGSESASAGRMRKLREKEKASLCDGVASLCDSTVTNGDGNVRNCYTEIEKEKETEIDKEKETDKEEKKTKKTTTRFAPPTLEELTAFISENHYKVNPEKFLDYYNANGWMVGKTKMKDWKATVRNWDRRERENPTPKQYSYQNKGQVQQKFKPEGRDLSFLEK